MRYCGTQSGFAGLGHRRERIAHPRVPRPLLKFTNHAHAGWMSKHPDWLTLIDPTAPAYVARRSVRHL